MYMIKKKILLTAHVALLVKLLQGLHIADSNKLMATEEHHQHHHPVGQSKNYKFGCLLGSDHTSNTFCNNNPDNMLYVKPETCRGTDLKSLYNWRKFNFQKTLDQLQSAWNSSQLCSRQIAIYTVLNKLQVSKIIRHMISQALQPN